MTKDGQEYSYKTCELQENYLATAQRPATVAQMTSTYMTMYTGVLSPSAVAANCAASADRTVMIQALGTPFKAGDKGQWRLQEALQFIEIIVETRNLAGTCARIRSTDAADTTLNRKRRSRKHRSGRGFNSAAVAQRRRGRRATTRRLCLRRLSLCTAWCTHLCRQRRRKLRCSTMKEGQKLETTQRSNLMTYRASSAANKAK